MAPVGGTPSAGGVDEEWVAAGRRPQQSRLGDSVDDRHVGPGDAAIVDRQRRNEADGPVGQDGTVVKGPNHDVPGRGAALDRLFPRRHALAIGGHEGGRARYATPRRCQAAD